MSAHATRAASGRPAGLSVRVLFTLLCVISALPAWAHHSRTPHATAEDGISIPDLMHGQMAVIAANRAAVLDLAARQTPTDRVMRRLETYINLQFSTCFWGLVPGSLEDEDSPFNECTHAYLAATRALLLHLQEMPGDRGPARALMATVELAMLNNRAPLVLCRYSGESFNTADVIRPDWRGVLFHPASLLSLLGLALAIAGGGGMAAWWMQAPQGKFAADRKSSAATPG